MTSTWQAGNVYEDGKATRGWLVGHFIDPAQGIRSQNDVEVKWADHPAGDRRAQWISDDRRTTLVLLIQGRFRVDTTEGSAVLSGQGDYVMWGPGVDHSREALADSTVVTVRWPSHT